MAFINIILNDFDLYGMSDFDCILKGFYWVGINAYLQILNNKKEKSMHAVRFELTRVAPLDLESNALDRSAKHASSRAIIFTEILNRYR